MLKTVAILATFLLVGHGGFAAETEVERGEEVTVTGKVEVETRTVAESAAKVSSGASLAWRVLLKQSFC